MSVLERMDELVAEHMIGVAERRGHRQDHPPLRAFGDTAGALADRALEDVGLLELRMAGVENDRLAAGQRVPEDARQPRVPALGHAAGHRGGLGLFRVVVDVEVLRFQDLEVEAIVLDLVSAEVLRFSLRWKCGQSEDRRQEARTERHAPLVSLHQHQPDSVLDTSKKAPLLYI